VRRPRSDPQAETAASKDGGDKVVEVAAVRLLARREHSTEELRRKLESKGHPSDVVAGVVEKLAARRLVSDDRFLANFVHHHARRGQGPVRIRAELRQQGIAAERIEQELDQAAVDWNRLAAEVRRRKFGAAAPRIAPERAKQARFLQYRGFSPDQIRAALSRDPDAGFEPDPDDGPAVMDPDGPDPDPI
jgi:regulatory protein